MKKFWPGILTLFLFINISLQARTVRIAACEWEPYTGEKINGKGLLTLIVVEALKRGGHSAEIVFFPWARAMEEGKMGNVDALLGASFTKERAEFFQYSSDIWINKIGFFADKTRSRKKRFTTLEALAPATVGVLNGSFLIDNLKRVNGLTVDVSPEIKSNIKKLYSARIDYLLEDKTSIEYIINTEFPEYKGKLVFIEPAYKLDRIYIVFSKKKSDFKIITADFNKGLSSMKRDGTIKKLSYKFGVRSN